MIDEVLQNIHHVGRYVVEWYRRVAAAFCPICLSMKTTNAVFQIDCEIYLWIFTVWKVAGVFFPLSWYQVIPRVPNHKPEQIFLLKKEMLVKFYLALPPESRESPTVTFSLVIHWPAIIFYDHEQEHCNSIRKRISPNLTSSPPHSKPGSRHFLGLFTSKWNSWKKGWKRSSGKCSKVYPKVLKSARPFGTPFPVHHPFLPLVLNIQSSLSYCWYCFDPFEHQASFLNVTILLSPDHTFPRGSL